MPPSTPPAVIDTGAPAVDQSAIRTLVHKRLPENVLLTDIRACSGHHFMCTGRLPTDHPLFNDGGRIPREDILFYTEVGRQASLAVTHAFLNASLDDVFIFEGSEAALTEAIWRPPVPSASDSFVIEIKVRETVRRKNVVSRVIADHVMTVGDEQVFGGTGTWTIQPAALFKRLRRTSVEGSSPRAADLPPATIAESPEPLRPYPGNVVISVPDYRQDSAEVDASLIVDREHPYFFDHPCDHVPGMLLLEGCAQLALGAVAECGVATSRRPAIMAYDVDFKQFVECDLPTALTARLTAAHRGAAGATLPPIEIVIAQRGVVAGTARMSIGLAI
jgi:hypothetical protein